MDQRIAADAAMVRGYLLREDCLYLSLMADAGIYVWKRLDDAEDSMLPDSFERNPDAALQEAIRRASPDYTEAIVETGGGGEARYLSDRYDLNGDGRAEVFAYLMGSIFCGTGGCNLLLFEEDVDGYRLVSNLPLSRLPIIVSDRRSNGWRDLLKLESGGGAPSSFVRYAFDGKKYVEQARLPAQPIPVGVQLLLPRGNFDDGIPLAPRS